MNDTLWNVLKEHFGHDVEIAIYGDIDNPANVSLEDVTTGSVILDAELYTIIARDDVESSEEKDELAKVKEQLEHYKEILRCYVDNDLQAATGAYVLDALEFAGATAEDIKELGFGDL